MEDIPSRSAQLNQPHKFEEMEPLIRTWKDKQHDKDAEEAVVRGAE